MTLPVASKSVEHILLILQVNYWKKVGFTIQTRILGDKRVRTDCRRASHTGDEDAGGSNPCGSAPTTPWIALSKWKLAELQVNYWPNVRVFWVFPLKMGIERRRSMTVHTTDVREVVRPFMGVQ